MTDPRAPLAEILTTIDPKTKANLARKLTVMGLENFPSTPPEIWPAPARRPEPPLVEAGKMRKRGLGSLAGRQALLHAIAHIELNAIDLAADMAGRFAHEIEVSARDEFINDWMSVMADEARHFLLVSNRLEDMGTHYGALPAHDGLFDAAARTSFDIQARLAIAPLVLEARGLDVTPSMIERFKQVQDLESAAILEVIYEEEIGHVAMGIKWFRHLSANQHKDPAALFKLLVGKYFPGGLKRPFNDQARSEAGFERQWYEALARN